MKNSEIRELTTTEVRERIENNQEHLTKLRLNHSISPLDNPMEIRQTRREIARLKTELSKRFKQANDTKD